MLRFYPNNTPPRLFRRIHKLAWTISVGFFCVIGMTGLLFLPGCGGGGGGSSSPDPSPSPSPAPSADPAPSPSPDPSPSPSPSPSPVVQVSIQPSAITLLPIAQKRFVGTVENASNLNVVWSVAEGTAGGTVSTTGQYTAPTMAGVYHIVATSVVDSAQSATATVTVPVIVTVSPARASTVSNPVTFTSSVNNPSNASVTWTVQEGDTGGTITPGGVYTPPGLGGVFHIIATSTADGSAQGIATVTVKSGGATGVIQ